MNLNKLNGYGNINLQVALGDKIFKVLYMHYGVITKPIKQHCHSVNCYELHLITQGKGVLLISDEEKYYTKINSLVMTGPNVLHEQISVEADPMYEYCICFEVSKGKSLTTIDEKDIYDEVCRIFLDTKFWFGEDDQNLLDIILKISDELDKKHFGYYINLKNLVGQLIVSTVRNYIKYEDTINYVPIKSLDDKRLSIIDDFFLGIKENSTLTDLAKNLGLSTRQTERILKKFYSQSFNEKKLQAKLTAVSNLLTTTCLSVTKIAEITNFSSLEHLCAAFKKHYKVSPSEYRKIVSNLN